MDLQLVGRTALVSGSTKGIGFAVADLLAREGARVIINGRTEEAVSQAKEEIGLSTAKASIEGFAADLATAAGCKAIAQRFPEVDILVNNLGIFERKAFEEIADEE